MDGCQRHNPTGLGVAGISTGMESTFAVKIMDLAPLPDLCPAPPGPPGTALSLYVYWEGEIHFTNGVKDRSEGEGGRKVELPIYPKSGSVTKGKDKGATSCIF